jgi:hypothetical protein
MISKFANFSKIDHSFAFRTSNILPNYWPHAKYLSRVNFKWSEHSLFSTARPFQLTFDKILLGPKTFHHKLVAQSFKPYSCSIINKLVRSFQSGKRINLYYKHTTIVNYTSSVVDKLKALLTDDARVVIYDHHVFIVQTTGLMFEV